MSSERYGEGVNALTSSSVSRGRYKQNPSLAYSDWHRELAPWYTAMDVDLVEYDHQTHRPYLLEEVVTIPTNVPITKARKRYPVHDHKRKVLAQMADLLDIPAVAIWTTPECEQFAVERLDANRKPRRLVGEKEYCDWLDEFRLG